jgi:16S rRNA (uracil1498-N3)-methyltransferase
LNLILLKPADWINDETVVLDDRRHQHIVAVLKSQPGQVLKVGALGGQRGSGTILAIDDKAVRIHVQLTLAALQRHPFDLILALPRPKMLRRVFRTASEMGVAHLHLIHSARVEKSYWQSPLLKADRIAAALEAGLERAGDTLLPEVHLHRRFRPFIEDILPTLAQNRPCWIADRNATAALRDEAKAGLVLLGPEGGFIPFEIELAESVGAMCRHLGERTLSVDTAVAAALAQALPQPVG